MADRITTLRTQYGVVEAAANRLIRRDRSLHHSGKEVPMLSCLAIVDVLSDRIDKGAAILTTQVCRSLIEGYREFVTTSLCPELFKLHVENCRSGPKPQVDAFNTFFDNVFNLYPGHANDQRRIALDSYASHLHGQLMIAIAEAHDHKLPP
jgi:hypothetical protein